MRAEGSDANPVAPTSVLITIPARNEENRLRDAVIAVRRALQGSDVEYLLSVAEDGSTDDTRDVIADLSGDDPALIALCDSCARGRGFALRRMWSRIAANAYVFVDADLAMGAGSIRDVIQHLQSGADVVTGSRYVPGARVNRPPVRHLTSRAYNWVVRSWFRDHVKDHQCGLKGFTSRALRSLLPLTSEDSWFWDTEVLVFASELGFRIDEIPVEWEERKVARTQVGRLLSDLRIHGVGLVRLLGRAERIANSGKIFGPREQVAMRSQPTAAPARSLASEDELRLHGPWAAALFSENESRLVNYSTPSRDFLSAQQEGIKSDLSRAG